MRFNIHGIEKFKKGGKANKPSPSSLGRDTKSTISRIKAKIDKFGIESLTFDEANLWTKYNKDLRLGQGIDSRFTMQDGGQFNDLVNKYQSQGWESLTPEEQEQYRNQYSTLVRPSGENQFDAMQIMEPAVSTAKRLPYGAATRQMVGNIWGDISNNLQAGFNSVNETMNTPIAMGYSSVKNYGPMGLLTPVMLYNATQNPGEVLPNYNRIIAEVNKNPALGRKLPYGPQTPEAINKALQAQKQAQASDALGIDSKKNPWLAGGVNLASDLLTPGVAIPRFSKAMTKTGRNLNLSPEELNQYRKMFENSQSTGRAGGIEDVFRKMKSPPKEQEEAPQWLLDQLKTKKEPIELLDNPRVNQVISEFRERITTPEGIKRMQELGITSEEQKAILDNFKVYSDPNPSSGPAYYNPGYDDYNMLTKKPQIGINPSLTQEPFLGQIVRHEIEHGVQNAINKTSGDLSKPSPIDNILNDLELKKNFKEGYSAKADPKRMKEYFSDKQAATNYFLKGSQGREKSAFAAEVQQFMLEKGIIKHPYEKITPEKIDKAIVESKLGNDDLRLFKIIKNTDGNKQKIAEALNKMLTVTGAAALGYGATREQKQKGGYVVTRSNERKGKTHKVTGPDGSVKYFGDPNMGERGKSKYGEEAFYKRHAKNLKNNPHFRAYARKTWQDGGKLTPSEEAAAIQGVVSNLYGALGGSGGSATTLDTPNMAVPTASNYLKNLYQSPEYKKRLQNEINRSEGVSLNPSPLRSISPEIIPQHLIKYPEGTNLSEANDYVLSSRINQVSNIDALNSNESYLGLKDAGGAYGTIGAMNPRMTYEDLPKVEGEISKSKVATGSSPQIMINPMYYDYDYKTNPEGQFLTALEKVEHASHIPISRNQYNVNEIHKGDSRLGTTNITPYAQDVIQKNTVFDKDNRYYADPSEVIAKKRALEYMMQTAPKGTFDKPFNYGDNVNTEHYNFFLEKVRQGDNQSTHLFRSLFGPDADINEIDEETLKSKEKNYKNIMNKIAMNQNESQLHTVRNGGKINLYSKFYIRNQRKRGGLLSNTISLEDSRVLYRKGIHNFDPRENYQEGGDTQDRIDNYSDFHYNTYRHKKGPDYYGTFWQHADPAKRFAIQGHNSRFNVVDRPDANVGFNTNLILNPYNTDQMVSGVIPGMDARLKKGRNEFTAKVDFPNATMQGAKPEFNLGYKRAFQEGGQMGQPQQEMPAEEQQGAPVGPNSNTIPSNPNYHVLNQIMMQKLAGYNPMSMMDQGEGRLMFQNSGQFVPAYDPDMPSHLQQSAPQHNVGSFRDMQPMMMDPTEIMDQQIDLGKNPIQYSFMQAEYIAPEGEIPPMMESENPVHRDWNAMRDKMMLEKARKREKRYGLRRGGYC
jgi:hypothetical protein